MSTEKFILNKMSKSKKNSSEWKKIKEYLEYVLKNNPMLLIRQDIKTQEELNIDDVELINITIDMDMDLFKKIVFDLKNLKKCINTRICVFFNKNNILEFEEI